jgi:hypothetical protein
MRRLVVLFLLFWLPLQGWGVSVMPFSRPGSLLWMQVEQNDAAAEDMPCCPQHAQHHDGHTQTHDGCSFCHLAGAPAVLGALPLFSPLTGTTPLPALTLPSPDDVPGRLERPPRS